MQIRFAVSHLIDLLSRSYMAAIPCLLTVCSPTVAGTCLVSGFIPIEPEQKTKPPATMAWAGDKEREGVETGQRGNHSVCIRFHTVHAMSNGGQGGRCLQ